MWVPNERRAFEISNFAPNAYYLCISNAIYQLPWLNKWEKASHWTKWIDLKWFFTKLKNTTHKKEEINPLNVSIWYQYSKSDSLSMVLHTYKYLALICGHRLSYETVISLSHEPNRKRKESKTWQIHLSKTIRSEIIIWCLVDAAAAALTVVAVAVANVYWYFLFNWFHWEFFFLLSFFSLSNLSFITNQFDFCIL